MRSAVVSALGFRASLPSEIDTDFLVMPIFEGEDIAAAMPDLAAAAGTVLSQALQTREIQGRPYELFLTPLSRPWRASKRPQPLPQGIWRSSWSSRVAAACVPVDGDPAS